MVEDHDYSKRDWEYLRKLIQMDAQRRGVGTLREIHDRILDWMNLVERRDPEMMMITATEPSLPCVDKEPVLRSLMRQIADLHDNGAYHKKRGFMLKEADNAVMSNHLIEEAVEVQADLVAGSIRDAVEELGDLLANLLHIMYANDIEFEEVCEKAQTKLADVFVFSKDEVLSTNPGFGRKNRPGG